MFSMVTVASSTRMPTARARPPRVMMFRVWPVAARAARAASTASGIEVAMITVERQLPRNRRIITLVRAAAMIPSRTTPEMAAFTNSDWSFSRFMRKSAGRVSFSFGIASLTPCTMARVEAEPAFSTVVSTAREPSTCTMLCCGGEPSRTWPTSWM